MKALPIDVYKSQASAVQNLDFSNGGITSRHDRLLLIHEEGFVSIDENNPPENLVKIVTRNLGDGVYKHIEPYKSPTRMGYMCGGTYASSSDSRFSRISHYPLPVHDRQETQAEYDRLSR